MQSPKSIHLALIALLFFTLSNCSGSTPSQLSNQNTAPESPTDPTTGQSSNDILFDDGSSSVDSDTDSSDADSSGEDEPESSDETSSSESSSHSSHSGDFSGQSIEDLSDYSFATDFADKAGFYPKSPNVKWVSPVGTTNNLCTLTKPCSTLQEAVKASREGGKIAFLVGDYQSEDVTISKSLSIYGKIKINDAKKISFDESSTSRIRFNNTLLKIAETDHFHIQNMDIDSSTNRLVRTMHSVISSASENTTLKSVNLTMTSSNLVSAPLTISGQKSEIVDSKIFKKVIMNRSLPKGYRTDKDRLIDYFNNRNEEALVTVTNTKFYEIFDLSEVDDESKCPIITSQGISVSTPDYSTTSSGTPPEYIGHQVNLSQNEFRVTWTPGVCEKNFNLSLYNATKDNGHFTGDFVNNKFIVTMGNLNELIGSQKNIQVSFLNIDLYEISTPNRNRSLNVINNHFSLKFKNYYDPESSRLVNFINNFHGELNVYNNSFYSEDINHMIYIWLGTNLDYEGTHKLFVKNNVFFSKNRSYNWHDVVVSATKVLESLEIKNNFFVSLSVSVNFRYFNGRALSTDTLQMSNLDEFNAKTFASDNIIKHAYRRDVSGYDGLEIQFLPLSNLYEFINNRSDLINAGDCSYRGPATDINGNDRTQPKVIGRGDCIDVGPVEFQPVI